MKLTQCPIHKMHLSAIHSMAYNNNSCMKKDGSYSVSVCKCEFDFSSRRERNKEF